MRGSPGAGAAAVDGEAADAVVVALEVVAAGAEAAHGVVVVVDSAAARPAADTPAVGAPVAAVVKPHGLAAGDQAAARELVTAAEPADGQVSPVVPAVAQGWVAELAPGLGLAVAAVVGQDPAVVLAVPVEPVVGQDSVAGLAAVPD
jgi:hypothetical protein